MVKKADTKKSSTKAKSKTKELEAKVKKKKKKLDADVDEKPNKRIIEVHLEDKANEEYYKYGIAVIEDRAIFGSIDGLKPVARRALWAAHEMGLRHNKKADKAAKVVGDTLGNYHPHGDQACYGAIVTAAKSPMNLVDGEGNWGTMNDSAAAYRYTNMRLSKYADAVFFDPFYLPTVDYIPNYDGSKMEPLILPALLPNAILNGNFGITPGVNTRTPSFTLPSVLKVLREAIAAGECTPKMCMPLVFSTKYGGRALINKEEFMKFYKSGKGKVTFESVHTEPNPKNEIRFDRFAPISDIAKTLTKIDSIVGVAATRDDSDKHDIHQVAYVVTFAKSLKGDALKTAIRKVEAAFSASWGFSVQVTDRTLGENGDAVVKLKPTTIPKLIMQWINYRMELEVRACSYWMDKRKKEIAHQELLRKAIKMIDFLFKAVKTKGSREDYYNYIAKGMKITFDEAKVVGNLPLVSLRSMEDKDLVAKIKELQAEYDTYEGRKKNPKKYIAKHLDVLEKELNDHAAKAAKKTAKSKK
jgi:DNA gyrase subunit A